MSTHIPTAPGALMAPFHPENGTGPPHLQVLFLQLQQQPPQPPQQQPQPPQQQPQQPQQLQQPLLPQLRLQLQ